MNSTHIQFTKEKDYSFTGTIEKNPSLDQVELGLHISDYMGDFGNRKYGCMVEFSCDQTHLIIRRSVLDGQMNWLQVWRDIRDFRNVYHNYKDIRKTSRGIQALTN